MFGMPTTSRGQIFGYFDRDRQVEIIETASAEIGKLIADLPHDDRVDILKSVKPEIVDELLPFIPAFDRRDILRLKSYAEGTAGAMMTSSVAKIGEGLTVQRGARRTWPPGTRAGNDLLRLHRRPSRSSRRGRLARQLVSAMGKPTHQDRRISWSATW